MNIITYHSSNAKPHEAWLAYVELDSGEQWLVRCTGHTELEAKTKAQVLWDRERTKYNRNIEPLKDDGVYTGDRRLENAMTAEAHIAKGRGSHLHGMAGKIWVINRSTHHLCRIDPNELAKFEQDGYVRGGPRSK